MWSYYKSPNSDDEVNKPRVDPFGRRYCISFQYSNSPGIIVEYIDIESFRKTENMHARNKINGHFSQSGKENSLRS
jgi:hypothetical protein